MRPAASAILLSGGYAHPFAETSAALAAGLHDRGLAVAIHEDVESAVAALPDARLLIVNALWWTMQQDAKYAPFRAEHARTLADADMATIVQHVARGGSLLALHTATICWDTQPGWRALMGGGWTWGRSHHPPLGPVSVALTPAGAALSAGAACFDLIDEAYHALDPAPDCRILAHAAAGGEPQPVVWTRRHQRGRVAVDALGHDAVSLAEPGHAALIAALVDWLLEEAGDARA